MKLLVYNPEHDYALADGGPNFVALKSAAQFAFDCAPFMRYLFEDEDALFPTYRYEKGEFRKMYKSSERYASVTEIVPWGWDAAVAQQLRRAGVPENLLPDDRRLQLWRDLAHRKTSSQALDFLREHHPEPGSIPESPRYLTSVQEVEDFVKTHPDAIFKSPYSGNGRGHLYVHGNTNPTFLRQCTGVIKRQGGIMAEKQYTVVQDFAMEFSCTIGDVNFRGYSLFKTQHYGYGGNLLMPDEEILRFLSPYINVDRILAMKECILDYLKRNIAPYYEGDIGVDMFVYQEDGKMKWHPFVEMNMRKTMGLAAHDIYAKYCHPQARGIFEILYEPRYGKLKKELGNQRNQSPLKLEDGLWRSGTVVLNPVTEATQYAVVVRLDA
ncbi:MAG: hypothetical protein II001_04975 [Bacteroidales bacterium]|jgi:hypothetical protein|nr:hypothetical protein [Bacteroidales bacterium]